jgi:small nuclear ribonucleoprotein
MKIERPLDMLNNCKGKEVLINLKNDKILSGTLTAFDIHINIVLDNAKEIENDQVQKNLGLIFIRGDIITHISQ